MTAFNLLASPRRQTIAVNLIRPLLLDLIFSGKAVPGLRFALVNDEESLATALGNVLARGGSISGQAGPLMNLFTNRVAIAGKHELRETTVVGAKKERAGGPGNLDKLTKKVQSKGISKAKHAI